MSQDKEKLSGKNLYYARAIQSIKRAGLVSFIISSFTFLTLAISLFWTVSKLNNQPANTPVAAIFIFILISGASTMTGALIWSKNLNPNATLAILIIQLVFCVIGLVVFGSTLVPMIYTIISLTKWNIFRDFFYDYKTRKDTQLLTVVKSHGRETTKNTGFTVLALCTLGFGVFCGTISGTSKNIEEAKKYEETIEEARSKSYDLGQSHGIKNGYDRGYEDGKQCMAKVAKEIITFGQQVTDVYSCKEL